MKVFNTVLFALLIAALVAACSSETTVPVSAPQSLSSPAGNQSLFRATAASYWEAFNRYDFETVKSYYTPAYVLEEEEYIQRDIALLEQFGVTLGIKEKVAPFTNEEGGWSTVMRMDEPTGVRIIRMTWVDSDGEWLLNEVTEIPE